MVSDFLGAAFPWILMRAGIIPRPLGRNKLFQITRR